MAYRKYIRRGGKIYGPYIYESKRIGGKVVSRYVGKHEAESKHHFEKNTRRVIFSVILIIILANVFLLAYNSQFFEKSLIGRTVIELSPIYKINETVTGKFNLVIQQGELIPSDSLLRLELNNQSSEISLSQLVSLQGFSGSYYVKNSNLSGEGQGYGLVGKKKIYPVISFKFIIKSEGQEQPTEQQNETIEQPMETENKSEPIFSGKPETTGETPIETPSEQPTETPIETPQTPAEPSIETPTETPSETPTSPQEQRPSFGIGITGQAVLENEVSGEVSFEKLFEYELGENEQIEVIEDSIYAGNKSLTSNELNIEQTGSKIKISTNYYEEVEGFGNEYMGDDTETIIIVLEQFDIKAEEGILKVSLDYENITIVSIEKQIKVEESSLTREAEGNITELNLTEINLTLIQNLTNETIITNISGNLSETIIQYSAVIGKPVRWKKIVSSSEETNMTIQLPREAVNISVKKIENQEEISAFSITGQIIKGLGRLTGFVVGDSMDNEPTESNSEINFSIIEPEEQPQILTEENITEIPVELEQNETTAETITEQPEEENENIILEINELVKEIEVEYYTEAPQAVEESTSYGKKIVISGPDNLHYENVLAYTSLPYELVNEKSIKLYWLKKTFVEINNITNISNGSGEEIIEKIEINFTAYDTNNNSKLDYIEWIVPSLSNQTYELSISIINIYSHPTLGGNWSVEFNTTGTADLTITATIDANYTQEATRWSSESEDSSLYDLKFLDLRCGNNSLNYSWLGENCSENECSVFIKDYNCSETSAEVSKVLTARKHVLKFNFGGQEAYAYNDVTLAPQINFTDPTPANGTSTTSINVEINISILNASDLDTFVWNWNSTNYTFYNDSLVLAMNFDNVSSIGENATIAVDVSKYSNNGTLKSGAVWDSSGKYGGAVIFNGVKYIVTKNNLKLGRSFSVAAWVKPYLATGTYLRILETAHTTAFYLGTDITRGKYKLIVNNPNSPYGTVEGGVVTTGVWQYVLATYNGSMGFLYVDGQLVSNGTFTAPASISLPLYIGVYSGGGSGWNGSIDEPKVYNRSLSADEVKQQYYSNLYKYDTDKWAFYSNQTGLTSGGKYYYKGYAKDSSGNENSTELRELNTTNVILAPQINFTDPTPANGTLTYSMNVEINISILNASDLDTFVWNWNSTNYTFYNDSLALAMNFDNVSSIGENFTTSVDSSVYGNDGTLYGGAKYNTTAKYGSSVNFQAAADYIKSPASSNFNWGNSKPFTVSAWIYPTALADYAGIVSKTSSTRAASYTWLLAIFANGRVGSYSAASGWQTVAVGAITTKNWQYVTYAYNGSNLSYYVNANFIGSNTFAYTDTTTHAIIIGPWYSSYPYYGLIDEVRIWNTTLSVDEINQSYNSNLYKHDTDKWAFYSNQPLTSGGKYYYQGYAKGNSGNENSTELRELNVAKVTLISPASSSSILASAANFNCNASNFANLANITLYLWNSTGSGLFYENTQVVTGTYNSSSWTVNNLADIYSWNCLAYDDSNNFKWADSNYTLTTRKALEAWGSVTATITNYTFWSGASYSTIDKLPDLSNANYPYYIEMAVSPQAGKEEAALIEIDNANYVNVSIWNGTSWLSDKGFGNKSLASTTYYFHTIDVEYFNNTAALAISEGYSGGGSDTSRTVYKVWDGASWAAEKYTLADVTGTYDPLIQELACYSQNNECVLIQATSYVATCLGAAYAQVWNGTEFDPRYNKTIMTGAANEQVDYCAESVDVEYDDNGNAILVWINYPQDKIQYILWNSTSKTWGTRKNVTETALATGIYELEIDAFGGNASIVIFDVNIDLWGSFFNGASWTVPQKIEAAAAGSYHYHPFDVSFNTSGMPMIAWANASNSNSITWNGTNWTNPMKVPDTSAANLVYNILLTSNPHSSERILITSDSALDVFSHVWNGTDWDPRYNRTLDTYTQGVRRDFGAVYFSRDVNPPSITIVSPLNQTYTTATIDFNVSTDENTSWCGFSLDNEINVSMTKFNESYFNFTNATMTAGGHNVTFSCYDIYYNTNTTDLRWFGVSVAGNNIPETTIPSVSPAPAYTDDDITCAFTVTDANAGDTLTANCTWYRNNVVNITNIFSVTNGVEYVDTLKAANTTKGENWSCGVMPYDETDYGDWKNSTNATIINKPPTISILSPDDNTQTTDRTPEFNYSGSDADSDSFTFEVNISCYDGCSVDNRMVTGLTGNYTVIDYLLYLIDNDYNYNWSVRSFDSWNYSTWSSARVMNISSLIVLALPTPYNVTNFGALNPGETKNTTTDDPAPLKLQNDGNCLLNVSLNASQLFVMASSPSDNFMYKIDNVSGEEGAFNWAQSNTTWKRFPLLTGLTVAVTALNWTDATDSAEVDLLVSVPSDEPTGNRSSIINFQASLDE